MSIVAAFSRRPNIANIRPAGVVIIGLAMFGLACADNSGGSAAGGSSSGAKSAPHTVKIGEAMVSNDGKSVTVVSFKRNYASSNEFEKPAAGKECVQVVFALANTGKSEWSLPTAELAVVDNNGQKYTESLTCGSGDNVSSLVGGGKAQATQYYEVTANAPLNANFVPNPFESDVFQTPLQ